MKPEMIKVYRKSSPRTGKDFDTRLILRKQLQQHLAAGWMQMEAPKKKVKK